jgi:hypothetical protein
VPGGHLVQVAQRRPARGLPAEQREQLGQSLVVEHRREDRVGQDRLRFRAEQRPAVVRVVVERLHAEPVAGQEEPLGPAVPDAEGVHPVEPLDALLTPLQVGPQHHFGVRPGGEGVPVRAQLLAQFGEVVDLPAVGQHDRSLGHRLPAAGHIDDGQPAVPDRGPRRQPQPGVVGPPAGHRLRHGRGGGPFGGQIA